VAGSSTASGSHCQIHQEREMNRPTCSKPAPAAPSKAGGVPAASLPGLVSRIKKLVLTPETEWVGLVFAFLNTVYAGAQPK
jgi:hypothetical protein